jgi:Fe-S-cluster containining protein
MDKAEEIETPFRAVDDVGVRLPASFREIDPAVKAVVKRLAGITRGAGIVMAAREIQADPTGPLRTILAVLRLLVFGRAQQTIDEVTQNAPQLGCKAGCAWCCHQNVEVTVPEAILIAAHLAGEDDPRRARVAAAAATLGGLDAEARRRAGKPCPLLVDNRCSVYEDRPLMCRGLMAADADACRRAYDPAGAGDAPLAIYPLAQYFILGDQAGLRGILKDMLLQHDRVEMTKAVAAILADPDIVERWLAREPAFGPEMVLADESDPAAAG